MTNPAATIVRLRAALADRYRVERELGAGGMATVYLAHDLRHERDVAIKVLRDDLAVSLGAARFFREIKIAARLQHPNVLPLLDSGEVDAVNTHDAALLYYVMPYIKGQSLRERLARDGALPIQETIRLLGDVVDALAEAHAQGVVHRDIKPDNVMLSGRHALVTDFGVAKAISEATNGGVSVTTMGMAVGTPSYMSPEQAAADPLVDHRSDIYAVGVMAYEMLTGKPPFTGGSPAQVLAAHITETPAPVSSARDAISPALEVVVMRCLAKKPTDRFQSASELHAALEVLVTSSGELPPGAATRRTGRAWKRYALAGFGAAAVGAIALWQINRPPATAVLMSSTQLTRLPGPEEFPAISPDGKSVAYRTSGPTDSIARVEYRRTDGGDAVPVSDALMLAGWSPGGDRLLVRSVRGLEIRPALGGQGTLINERASNACWSPDGAHVAYFVGDSLMVVGVNGETPRLVTRASAPHEPAWSPDGKWIAYVVGNNRYAANYNIAPSSIWIVPAAGGTPLQLTAEGAMSMSPTWAPDSRRLLFVSMRAGVRDVYQLNLTASGSVRGEPVRISTGLNPSLIALSVDGTQLAYSVATHHANIWKIRLSPTEALSSRGAVPVTRELQTIEALDISADGKWLVFDSDRQGLHQLYRMPLAGGPVRQLTRDSNPAFKPFVSPDGKTVAYHMAIGARRRIFMVGIDGGEPLPVSPGTSPDERNPSWSPDGKRIAWQVRTEDGSKTQVATRDAAGRWKPETALSLDGGLLALAWADQGTALLGFDSTGRIGSQPVNGGAFRLLNTAVAVEQISSRSTSAARSSDGRTAFFSIARDVADLRRGVIMAVRLADGHTRHVLRFDEPARPHSTASNGIAEYDGWLYFTLSDLQSDVWVASVSGLKQ